MQADSVQERRVWSTCALTHCPHTVMHTPYRGLWGHTRTLAPHMHMGEGTHGSRGYTHGYTHKGGGG